MLYYRGYKGSLSNVGDGYIGRIEEINKVLTYEGKSLAETENAFHKAVDCYIESKYIFRSMFGQREMLK